MNVRCKSALVALMVFGMAGMALAQDFSTDNALEQVKGIGGLLLGMIFLGFLVVGGYVIIQALVDARKQGGWGHFVVGVFMVLIAGFALWGLMSMSGQNASTIIDKIKISR